MSISVSEFFLSPSRPPGPGLVVHLPCSFPVFSSQSSPPFTAAAPPRPQGQGCRGRSPSAGFWPPAFPLEQGEGFGFPVFYKAAWYSR